MGFNSVFKGLKEVSVLWYQRPCHNPLLLAVIFKSVTANILLQRWKRWRIPWRNHDQCRFFGYWIICHVKLFSDRLKYCLPGGTQRERGRGANTSWETGGLDVITTTTTLFDPQRLQQIKTVFYQVSQDQRYDGIIPVQRNPHTPLVECKTPGLYACLLRRQNHWTRQVDHEGTILKLTALKRR